MRLEMIDRDEGQPAAKRDCFACYHADDESADQPRARGGRDSVKRIEIEARLGERLLDRYIEQLDMGARGDLRHDATISRMQVELRAHHARQDLAATIGG